MRCKATVSARRRLVAASGREHQCAVAPDRCCFDEPPRGLPACSRPGHAGLSKHHAVYVGRCCFASPSSTAAHAAPASSFIACGPPDRCSSLASALTRLVVVRCERLRRADQALGSSRIAGDLHCYRNARRPGLSPQCSARHAVVQSSGPQAAVRSSRCGSLVKSSWRTPVRRRISHATANAESATRAACSSRKTRIRMIWPASISIAA